MNVKFCLRFSLRTLVGHGDVGVHLVGLGSASRV